MYIPFPILSRTLADSNCLYNACSLALVGNENLAVYLRCLTSLELNTNAAFYADHPLIEYQHKNGAFSTMKNAFAMCISDTAPTAFEEDVVLCKLRVFRLRLRLRQKNLRLRLPGK